MRAVISGIAGFIGSNLCERLLKEGWQVVGVDNLMNGRMENLEPFLDDISFLQDDLCKEAVCRQVCNGADVVFHQAALGSVPRSVEDPYTTMRNNIMSTVNILWAAMAAGVRRFVYASSASVYGNVEPGLILEEDLPTAPFNPYAVSKLAGEEITKVFWHTYQFPTVSLRYFNVFGPRQDPAGQYAAVVPKFIGSMLKEKVPPIYGDGKQVRDFTHVDNVVEANILAAKADLEDSAFGRAYNVAAGSLTTVNELFKLISQETGVLMNPDYQPSRDGDVRGNASNTELAASVLGYYPRVDIEEGIRRTVEWYRANKWCL